MHSKNIIKLGCYALTAGLVLGSFICSPWIASSLFASTNYPISPVVTKPPAIGTKESFVTPSGSLAEARAAFKMELSMRSVFDPTGSRSIDLEKEDQTIGPGQILPIITEPPMDKKIDPADIPLRTREPGFVELPIVTLKPIVTTTPSVVTFTPATQLPSTPTPIPTPTSAPLTQLPSTPTPTSALVMQPNSTPIPGYEPTSKRVSVPSAAEPIVTEVPKQEAIIQRFYVGKQQYYVNDKKNEMDTVPVIKGGRTLMPIRYVSETFGAKVDWNSTDRKVTISFGTKLVELWIGKDAAIVDGSLKRLDVAPEIIDGRTVLPLRFVSENLGLKVFWDQGLQEVKITN